MHPSQADIQPEQSLCVRPRSLVADLLWNRPGPQLATLGLEHLGKAIPLLLPVNYRSPGFGSQGLYLRRWTV